MRFITFLTEAPFAKKTYRNRNKSKASLALKKKPSAMAPARKAKDVRRFQKNIVEFKIDVYKDVPYPPHADAQLRGEINDQYHHLPYTESVTIFVPVTKWREILRTRSIQKLPSMQSLSDKDRREITTGRHHEFYGTGKKLPSAQFKEKYGYPPLFTRTKSGALRFYKSYNGYPSDLMRVFFHDPIQKQIDVAMQKKHDKDAAIYEPRIWGTDSIYGLIWDKMETKDFIKSLREKWKEVNAEVFQTMDPLQAELNTRLSSDEDQRRVVRQYQAEIRTKLTQIAEDLSPRIQVTGFSFTPSSTSYGTTNPKTYNIVHKGARTEAQKGYAGGHWYPFISVRMKVNSREYFAPIARRFKAAVNKEFAKEAYALDYHGVGSKGVRLIMHGVEWPKRANTRYVR